MATASDLTLSTDGDTGTSVFKPLSKQNGIVEYIARDDDLSAASRRLRTQYREHNTTRMTDRFSVSLTMPLKRGDGSEIPYTAVDVARFNGEWVLPNSMSAAEREELGYMLRDLLGEAALKAAYEDLDPPV
jgi:hypothetical protein